MTDQATNAASPGLSALSEGLGAGAETMDSLYGDGSDHPACAKCGFCLKCGDCAVHGCGTGLASCAGCGALEGEQHMPNCPIEAPNVGGKRRAVGTSA